MIREPTIVGSVWLEIDSNETGLEFEFLYGKIKQNVCVSVISYGIHGLTSVPGGRLNKKDGLTRYGDSHVKDKTS